MQRSRTSRLMLTTRGYEPLPPCPRVSRLAPGGHTKPYPPELWGFPMALALPPAPRARIRTREKPAPFRCRVPPVTAMSRRVRLSPKVAHCHTQRGLQADPFGVAPGANIRRLLPQGAQGGLRTDATPM